MSMLIYVQFVTLLTAGTLASGFRTVKRMSPAFDKAKFMTTHNSYEKKPIGVMQSLDFGVRTVELDLWLYEFESRQEYCIGHFWCGEATQVGELGNPATYYLNAWLEQIRSWSLGHPDHAPITIMLDMKNGLGRGMSHLHGGFANLQGIVQSIFGDSLYWASSKPTGSWPSVDQLRGKILLVLSGNTNSRIFYQQDDGQQPHVAINDAGLVVEMHEGGLAKQVYYWTGRVDGDEVAWVNNGNMDTGVKGWPAIRDDNVVVAVYSSAVNYGLWYHVGILDPATLEITWGPAVSYDQGRTPTCRILANGQLEERHKHWWRSQVWVRTGTIDVANKSIQWESGAAQQDLPLFDPVAYSLSGAQRVEAREEGGAVRYRLFEQQAFQLIRYPQMFFVDWQPGCDGTGESYAPLNQSGFIGVRRGCANPPAIDGVATRVWQYTMSDANDGYGPGVFPATDEPDEAYKSWLLSFPTGISY